jgi:hypothetical protein
MFGFGNTRSSRRQVRNDTFGGSRMRNAALAGIGMLAWKWWRNRQASGATGNRHPTGSTTGTRNQGFQDTPYAGSSGRSGDAL